ncbi:hypothetical protein CI102_9838 [Trichoderma harzianum]|nr:hypothetical protein CI102_9838 [Trichoderma harzianum]
MVTNVKASQHVTVGHDGPRADLPRIWAPLGGSLGLRGGCCKEGGARYEYMNLVFRGSTGQEGRQDKRDQVDYSSPNSSEQKARGSAGKTAQQSKEKRGGRGCSDNDFRFKGVEWTGPPCRELTLCSQWWHAKPFRQRVLKISLGGIL